MKLLHGKTLVDNYAWLKEKHNPKTLAYLHAENAYTEAVMKPTKILQENLYKEILGRIKETDQELPVFDRGYWYYSRTVKGKSYPIECRRKSTMRAKEEIILDLNALGKGKKFISSGAVDVSPNGHLVAYTLDTTGFREYQLYIKDLRTGKVRPERLGKALQLAWGNDNETLFFVTEDSAKRWNKLWRYRFGGKPELVYEERDRLYWFTIDASRDNRYLFLKSASSETSEVRYLSLDKPGSTPKLFLARKENIEYDVDSAGETFYIRINDKGRNFRLVRTEVSKPEPAHWREVVPHRSDVMLGGVDLFQSYIFLSERHGGFDRLRWADMKTGKWSEVAAPEQARSMSLSANPDFQSKKFRYDYASLKTPASTFEFNPQDGKSNLLKQQPVEGSFSPKHYESKLVWAKARDGVQVPISLVYRAGLKPSAETPLLLYGYGSYGAPSDPYFSVSRLSLLDRGVVYAMAHVRGGGEFGTPWHDNGKMGKKMNTFTDFIDCGEYLVREGWTSHEMMAMNGGSAGGLLMGAVLNLKPNLVGQAIADVPFVDVINTMLDDSLPLTTGEYLEWGNPNNPEQFAWMEAYSPYDNVAAQPYPKLLVNTSLNDSQVLYHEPAKWVAKLRATKTDDNVLLLKTNMDAGHGGASGRYEALRETAFDYAFLLANWGISK